ncbi:hypothetical protein [Nocardia cyriacigeorgica]|uniref:hypothetical protein n=1 Tax=Nocardia cyriacigeorgica TaxID=135487 RepID=UPI002455C527|nr:hypothetical protein [Nocardia cyriacigeorgica]
MSRAEYVDARAAGYAAFHAGEPTTANPYAPAIPRPVDGTDLAEDNPKAVVLARLWLAGWQRGRDEASRTSRD